MILSQPNQSHADDRFMLVHQFLVQYTIYLTEKINIFRFIQKLHQINVALTSIDDQLANAQQLLNFCEISTVFVQKKEYQNLQFQEIPVVN